MTEHSRDLGLAASLVRCWVRQADVDAGKGSPGALTTAEKEELSRLRREVKVLRMKPDWAHVQLVPNSELKRYKRESGL